MDPRPQRYRVVSIAAYIVQKVNVVGGWVVYRAKTITAVALAKQSFSIYFVKPCKYIIWTFTLGCLQNRSLFLESYINRLRGT